MYNLAEIADFLNGTLLGKPDHVIQGVASLSRASHTDLSFFDNPALLDVLHWTNAGAVLVRESHASYAPGNCIIVPEPLPSIHLVASWFDKPSQFEAGIHPSALISSSAELGKAISIAEHSVIKKGVKLGDEVRIGANCVIEEDVQIDSGCVIHHGVHIHSGTRIAKRVIIESGSTLGAAPFNSLKTQGQWLTGPALGGLILGEAVHVGANSVICRGGMGDTFIATGVRIDNLVMIAHDVIIGPHSAIAGCAVIGAYAQIGADCIIGGASCVSAHVRLADNVVITGMSTVHKSVNQSGVYSSGTMVCEHRRWRRNAARFRRLDDYVTRLIKLEREVDPSR
ncbi:UDP-3-O-(3-hydroxymyristoyl)glucosamine N-acyltransferase [Legionella jordanis]|uniref:UDP-3-O-[3-hydroxymyristoyl] glucosamine N-acyltransferase n=1 Tax=Legionella jordanis TaxID=456 RepID=A0A0W0VBV4_9GAMM|nr:UDP-3-O-(3-hydroxymyristoyl)glucosamine N-acyltransferase [Legionella jordanis]KTD17334.1 UDP-3-O-[3-hydroxymyristoyl] glucosamine N-acyltransferase [Legionella jordanis]RMX01898.1 UDP-3-O-(3-hydroxymyristoyl)glucosamine N-acyltransferase [Legionella jordanis]RMX17688.1 UDP-3-O-(3-hydroxymyristoyl)glucosamine N-acyltransferase [Legionella jordanis]VEH11649.1 UDP-3-O-[3-hydroxymyristoyl] glucosamine N-acyltransferase [Legionella jordanis]HAT8712973.1 UDP-3-O-(3-hydroxymyristoyl)glucosamine N